ncbi:MAG: Xaa-Pro peptidase family protein [Armatimonadota bacterium]|nr:Xaa-Pro peptidase family protein [Armatimonadota bacterium]MDW8025003.1 Xaa-Pro peptidase family protein [Armatimonadota bacterium]
MSALLPYEERLKKLQGELRAARIDAMLITYMPNIRYLVGFTGTSGILLVGTGECVFITDGRYDAQAHKEVKGAKVSIAPRRKSYFDVAANLLKRWGISSIGIESERMSVAQFERLKGLLYKVRVRKLDGVVERMRSVKDEVELQLIRRAAGVADAAYEYALSLIRPGVKEREVALELERFIKLSGAEDVSFDIIVASGYRSAMAHGVASDKVIEYGDVVVLDFGAVCDGYHSDLTRTVAIGKADRRGRSIYAAVYEAQIAAIEAVCSGRTMKQVEAAARKKLRLSGYERQFKHGIGHGVGLEIHELPSPKQSDGGLMQAGCVVTIEPGVYIEGFCGARIEDMVLVKQDGYELLTAAQKTSELLVL